MTNYLKKSSKNKKYILLNISTLQAISLNTTLPQKKIEKNLKKLE